MKIDLEQMRAENARGYTTADFSGIKPVIPFLRTHVSPQLAKNLTSFIDRADDIKRAMAHMRQKNQLLSRPSICVSYMSADTGGVYTQAQTYLNAGNRGLFFVWYTLAEAYTDATICINRAEGVLRRGARAEVVLAFQGEVPKDAEKTALRFQRYSELLRMDPTGIALVKHQTEMRLENLFNFPASTETPFYEIFHPTTVLASMYAAEVYKIIYPLSE